MECSFNYGLTDEDFTFVKLRTAISAYGVVLDDVLVKDIDMPMEVLQAIENKAKADQIAKQTTLTDRLLKFKSIEVTKELVKSPNAKIIITDGKSMMLNNISDK